MNNLNSRFWVVLFLTIAIFFGLFFYYKAPIIILFDKYFNKSSTMPKLDDLSAKTQLDFISTTNGKIKVPEITKQEIIPENKLPAPAKDLLKNISSPRVYSVLYTDGSKGFLVEYTNPEKTDISYLNFSKSFNRVTWRILSGAYSAKSGIMDLESPLYKVSVQFKEESASTTDVKINFIIK